LTAPGTSGSKGLRYASSDVIVSAPSVVPW